LAGQSLDKIQLKYPLATASVLCELQLRLPLANVSCHCSTMNWGKKQLLYKVVWSHSDQNHKDQSFSVSTAKACSAKVKRPGRSHSLCGRSHLIYIPMKRCDIKYRTRQFQTLVWIFLVWCFNKLAICSEGETCWETRWHHLLSPAWEDVYCQ
jgi:hypothetical protein